ncbi:hypothetical protein [Methylobacterium sp. WL120]|uniref:hypothetical protein n=1 Tax=Methylobacterium sp. WL120 TaxID=2603887 RepID=UPI0011CB4F20|nr:hypothetical protein [Methylobacterium sp. WL120]TXM69655.1 hypothetical protein FV229_04740 [Methylobacterium sp. WL120]
MKRLSLIAGISLLLLAGPAVAYDDYDESQLSSSFRSSRAQEHQARTLDKIERIERDRYRDESRQRHNDEVLSRSSRRFDRR